ncbi:tautomerase family protein [Dyadobacter sp. CY261]|uniref:tautomerase family protein n=1 Tax=Dyadobacter sp. CY261 TaxID=2907203 RepID=UPI001F3B3524|nr:tautomerase family protein [Dyadobacter sp. CY261]
MSELIHSCVVEAFDYPRSKKFHRFFYFDEGDFIFPSDRTDNYTIIEIALFEGRSLAAKKKLYRLLFDRFDEVLDIKPLDLEITLTETPKHNWGIRGQPGDELGLGYVVEV